MILLRPCELRCRTDQPEDLTLLFVNLDQLQHQPGTGLGSLGGFL